MYAYDLKKSWTEIPSILSDGDFDDCEAQYRESGFHQANIPQSTIDQSFCYFDVYNYKGSKVGKGHSYRFLVAVNIGCYVEEIAVLDFPSLIELLSKLSTINMVDLMRDEAQEKMQHFLDSQT